MNAALMVVAAVAAIGLGGQPAGKVPKTQTPAPPAAKQAGPTIVVSNQLGLIIPRGKDQGLEVAEEGRGWVIRDGEAKFKPGDLADRSHPVEPRLQVNRFAVVDDIAVVKVTLSPADRPDEFIKALEQADKDRPPTLVDTKGKKYEAVGFVYTDAEIVHVRYTRNAPLKGLGEPGVKIIGRSTPDRHLTLIFTVSLGREVKEFRIGDKVLETYDPPVKCDQKQK